MNKLRYNRTNTSRKSTVHTTQTTKQRGEICLRLLPFGIVTNYEIMVGGNTADYMKRSYLKRTSETARRHFQQPAKKMLPAIPNNYNITIRPTYTLGCMNVTLLHSNNRHVSATHVAIFRVVKARTQIHLVICQSHSS
jgi:hypothetical protein